MKITYPKEPKQHNLLTNHSWKYGDVIITDYVNRQTVAWTMWVRLAGKRPRWCPKRIYERLKKSMLVVRAENLKIFVKGEYPLEGDFE